MRDVILAKNIVSLIPIVGEAMLAWVLVVLLATRPISLLIQISSGLWLLFLVAANLALGTLRSVQEPRQLVPGKAVKQSATTSRTSGFLTVALMLGSLLLYVPLDLGSRYFSRPWLSVLIFAGLATGAIVAYILILRDADRLMLAHRDSLAEELLTK